MIEQRVDERLIAGKEWLAAFADFVKSSVPHLASSAPFDRIKMNVQLLKGVGPQFGPESRKNRGKVTPGRKCSVGAGMKMRKINAR